WPPSGSPTLTGASRLTRVPSSSRPRAVRVSVSGTTSKARLPFPTSTTVRQTPATATESPTVAPAAVSAAATTSREPSNAATVPTSLTMPVNMRQRLRLVQVRLEENVVARGLDPDVEEVERRAELSEDVRPFAGENRRDEEEQLVHHARGEECGRERGPALEQERLDAVGAERAQLLLQRAVAQL